MKRSLELLSFLAILALLPPAPVRARQDCSCLDDLDALVEKIEADYAAFVIEIRGKRDSEYEQMIAQVRERASRAGTTRECIAALREFTHWFSDPHLFIGQFPKYDDAALKRFRAAAEHRSLSRAEAMDRLRSTASPDPAEGIWFDESAEMAVVPDPGKSPDRLVAIVLESRSEAWSPGDVRATLERRGDNDYMATLLMDDRSPRYIEAQLFKNGLIFRLAPYAWGRRYPLAAGQEGLLDDADPRAPTLTTRGANAVILSIPSHAPRYREPLEELISTHTDLLADADTLVVDIRGNEGGSSGTTNSLAPYFWSEEQEPRSGPDDPVVLASPDNLRAFQGWTEFYEETPEWLTELLADLEASDGGLVHFPSDDSGGDEPRPEVVSPSPRRFAILMDSGAVSAAEAFVLRARRHARVIVYGQNTGGSIDYQTVRILGLACKARGFGVGIPLIAASASLPAGGFNADGIPPDVRIPTDVPDPIGWILARNADDTGQ